MCYLVFVVFVEVVFLLVCLFIFVIVFFRVGCFSGIVFFMFIMGDLVCLGLFRDFFEFFYEM